MIHSPHSTQEAYSQIQMHGMPLIIALCKHLKISYIDYKKDSEIAWKHKHGFNRWSVDGSVVSHKHNDWIDRQHIDFGDQMHVRNRSGVEKGELVIVEENIRWRNQEPILNNSSTPLVKRLNHTEKRTVTSEKTVNHTIGWEIQSTTKVEYSGVEQELSVKASGEHAFGETTGSTKEISDEGEVTLTAAPYVQLIYRIGEGKIKYRQDVQETVEYDLFFVCEGKNDNPHGGALRRSKRKRSMRGSKTYCVFEVRGLDDLENTLRGYNRDYPNVGTDLIENDPVVREIWKKLSAVDYRKVSYKGEHSWEEEHSGKTEVNEQPLKQGR